MSDDQAGVRRTFALTIVVAGVAGILAAVGGDHAWAVVGGGSGFAGVSADLQTAIEKATAPLVSALALVVLAAYGVVLVTRGRFRLAVAWLALVASAGLVAAGLAAWVAAPRQVRDLVGTDGGAVHHTAWAVVSIICTVVLLVASVVAVRGVRGWPEMGRRYDAPAAQAVETEPDAAPDERTNLDLWRTIDEGRDPTTGRERGDH